MSDKAKFLRCYAEQDDDSWFAICLDLNLYSRKDSFDEVKEDLESQIERYIHEAITEDEDHFHDLIPRRAPVQFFVKYYWFMFLIECHLVAARMAVQPFKVEERIPQHI